MTMLLPTGLTPNADVAVAVADPHSILFTWDAANEAFYEIEIASGSTGTVYIDTGALAGTTNEHTQAIAESYVGEQLKFRVRSWTSAEYGDPNDPNAIRKNVPWSGWSYFRLVRAGVLEITAPANAATVNIAPTVTFGYTAGKPVLSVFTQRVKFVDNLSGDVMIDSGSQAFTGTYSPPAAILDSGRMYDIRVELQLSDSSEITDEITVTTLSGLPVVHISAPDASTYLTDRTIRFDYWVDAVELNWVANYIYRRKSSEVKWTLLERSTVPFPGAGQANALSFADTPPSNQEYVYSVRQATNA